MSSGNGNLNRIVYILAPQGHRLTCQVKVTSLMKWEAFSEQDFSDLSRLFQKRFESYLRPIDRSIILGLMQLIGRASPDPRLDGNYGREILDKMIATGRTFYEAGSHVRLCWEQPLEGELGWESSREGQWRPSLDTSRPVDAFATDPPIFIERIESRCGELLTTLPSGLVVLWLLADEMDDTATAKFCLLLAKKYPEAQFPVPACAPLDDLGVERPVAILQIREKATYAPKAKRTELTELSDSLRLRLRFRYGSQLIDWTADEIAVAFRAEGAIKRVQRDRKREAEVVQRLQNWGLTSEQLEPSVGFLDFDASDFSLQNGNDWRKLLTDIFPSLDKNDWEVVLERNLNLVFARPEDCYAESQPISDDSFSVEVGLSYGGVRVPLLPIVHRFLRQNRELSASALLERLAQSSFAIRRHAPEDAETNESLMVVPGEFLVGIVENLFELFDRDPLDEADRAVLSRWRVVELAESGLLSPQKANKELEQALEAHQKLAQEDALVPREPSPNLRASLRPYQKIGLAWLHRLSQYGASGLLADDMGLGKTVQTIAHLLECKMAGCSPNGSLIVAPTSVIDNWVSELDHFAPSLKTVKAHGTERGAQWDAAQEADVTVTSYSLLWRDTSILQSRRWSVVVLDEAQFIKNPASRTAEAARSLNCDRRLCLTGTPIENRLHDLWSQFEFLMPGYLGDEATFRRRLAPPEERASETAPLRELRIRLSQRLAPYILRRSKETVLADLPSKTEIVHPVSMTPRQAELYESVRLAMNQRIREEIHSRGVARSQLMILDALLKLRQICCDPRLARNIENAEMQAADSAKLAELLELLEELEAAGRRVLVFSQFAKMLDLIAAALREKDKPFLMLTGKTRERAPLIETFQTGGVPIFLISLKAGGVGLNLTAADSVIHFDPWWNPAVERQATDRVHRIGQEKPVFVYKLIAEDTIEAKILHLQREKSELAASLFAQNSSVAPNLDEAVWEHLFE